MLVIAHRAAFRQIFWGIVQVLPVESTANRIRGHALGQDGKNVSFSRF
jgi:hypothetical protein